MGNSLFFSFGASSSSAQLRLVCFPFAGGAATFFRPWSERLRVASGGAIEVVAVQLPGRGARFGEPSLTRMGAIADAVADAIPSLGEEPFAFYGHSMGAYVAFEVTRRLRARSARLPLHLIVSGARAPHMRTIARGWHHLDDRALARELERLGGTPDVILRDPELLALFLPILRADFEALETHVYEAQAPLDVPIRAFGGSSDAAASTAEVDAWRAHSTLPFAAKTFPGGHFFVDSARDQVLAEVLTVLGHRARMPSGEPERVRRAS
jgi:medium-chain acyl-[acyl-carrier-protein] hydrolase